ncbi:MAG TPA: hypothetical protein VMS04_01140 [Vicinamibacterales bacterium]|nr:hypothetical protein [Vicinamibacterales bacterium]
MRRVSSFAFFGAASLFVAATPVLAQSPAQVRHGPADVLGPAVVSFELTANPKFIDCLQDPNTVEQPSATVTVLRGALNDALQLHLQHFKPGLAFDLFTVQRSQLLSDGKPDPNFKNFGFAWYQSDVEVGAKGQGHVQIRTILLDDIFGFDPDAGVLPINTFHVGFWFDDPQDAAACGFDPTKPTPFNGAHKAGPMAMISVPDPTFNVGPLCTNPQVVGNTIACNP